MKRIFAAFLVLLCLISFASCQTASEEGTEETAESSYSDDFEETTVIDTVDSSEETTENDHNGSSKETTDHDHADDVLVPHEQKTITKEELGYTAVVASEPSKYGIADAMVDETGSVIITSYNPGTTVITVKNSYAEKIELTVTVGLDYSIESVAFDKFEMPDKYVYATDYGLASENTGADNSAAFQAAIDALSDGGTVYVPRGIYDIKRTVEIASDIIIRLEGILPEYNTEYSESIAALVNDGNFAVIRSGGWDMFMNHKHNDWGRNGNDNIVFTGGVIDMQGKNRCFVWCCADGVLLENVIMKDCPNDHAIQITGSDNVTVRDCMLAGYNVGKNVTTAETIQIEGSHPGAISGNYEKSPSRFEAYEYYHCENVVIENVYFGKSDKYGSHTFPIGHHGHTDKAAVTGLKIIGCTFDNPRVLAIRCFAYSDVEIADNKFISTESEALGGDGRYMIELDFGTGNIKVGDSYLALGYERTSCLNYNIHNNIFEIGATSKMGGAIKTLTLGTLYFDARAVSDTPTVDFYDQEPYSFTGYKMVGNRVENLNIHDNNISMMNGVATSAFYLNGIIGLNVENNDIDSSAELVTTKLENKEIYGAQISANCTSIDNFEKNFVVSASSKNSAKPIVMKGGKSDIKAFCNASLTSAYYNIIFSASDGGKIERYADYDGLLYVVPASEEGYKFDGYYFNGEKIDSATFNFNTFITVDVRFVKK